MDDRDQTEPVITIDRNSHLPIRPLDPGFPIERQLAVDAAPVVLVNLFTLDAVEEPAFLQVWQDDAAFMRRQPNLPKLCNLAIKCAFPKGILTPRVRGEACRLPIFGDRLPASVSEGCGGWYLRRVVARPSVS